MTNPASNNCLSLSEELNLTSKEEECVILKTVLDMINGMVNYEMMDFYGTPFSEARMKSSSHQKLFTILLIDFLSPTKDILKKRISYLDHLKNICENPLLSDKITSLKATVALFERWLSEQIVIKDIDIADKRDFFDLIITKKDLIQICGNISKHNITNLSWKISRLGKIIRKCYKEVPAKDIIIALDDLFERFESDNLILQTTILAEFLNNIRIGILEYLTPLYEKSIKYDPTIPGKYFYIYPEEICSDLGKNYFWELLNDVRSKFYIHDFKTDEIIWRASYKKVVKVQSKTSSEE